MVMVMMVTAMKAMIMLVIQGFGFGPFDKSAPGDEIQACTRLVWSSVWLLICVFACLLALFLEWC